MRVVRKIERARQGKGGEIGEGEKDTGFEKETESREEDRERELTEEARRERF